VEVGGRHNKDAFELRFSFLVFWWIRNDDGESAAKVWGRIGRMSKG